MMPVTFDLKVKVNPAMETFSTDCCLEFLGREQVQFPPAKLHNMTADGEMSDR